VTGTATIANSNIDIGVHGGTTLASGTTLTLIRARDGLFAPNLLRNTHGIVESGVTIIYDLALSYDDHNLIGTVAGGHSSEQSKALSEGFLGGLAFVNQGADILVGQGIGAAVRSSREARSGNDPGITPFGVVSSGYSRYDTGSHINMKGYSLVTGLASGVELAPGELTLGAFFEYGNGSYDTYNSFSVGSVKGDGDTRYIGGGVLGRLDFNESDTGHFFAEASGRFGRVRNSYASGDLRDSFGQTAAYNAASAYYGLHAGLGYVWTLSDSSAIELYGKYFWTRQEGEDVRLTTGGQVSFNAVDSHRLRPGGRYTYAINDSFSAYAGVAWEHEFDGSAKATTGGFPIDAPDITGDTGIGEIGLSCKPSATIPLSFDLGVQGYVGKREGVTGSLRASYSF
jgi:hypothetical protein